MDRIRLNAYAKVNLTLDVVGRRDDGYHFLKSVMQSVSLADGITLARQPKGIAVHADLPGLAAGEENIAWKAAAVFYEQTGIKEGVAIRIEKRIPTAAGLAGGTADAAAVLFGLNSLYGTGLSLQKLQRIGVKIGADLPFCLRGGTVLAEGIGEKLTPLVPFPPAVLLIVRPKGEIATGLVYKRLSRSAWGGFHSDNFIRLLQAGQSASGLSRALGNALEAVTSVLMPEIALWKRRLLEGGAHGASMSGSGPALFGVFSEEGPARQFQRRWGEEVDMFWTKPVKIGVLQVNGGSLP